MRNRTNDSLVNTLRLSSSELKKIIDKIEADTSGHTNPEREFVRWAYRVEAVQLVIEHGTGNKVTLPVATRNISRGGISILHSAFIHSNTPCEILLKVPGGKTTAVPGVVKRCNHITGRVHEIGIKFKSQVSMKDLLGLDPLNEAYSLERVDPSRLHGSVLIVTSSDMDRELMLTYLDNTNLMVNTADSVETGVSRAQKGCDLIVCDYHIGGYTAPDLINAINEAGCDMPVVVLTSDHSEKALDAIRESNASGVLTKPTTRDRLMQALAEFLHADGDGGPLYSILKESDASYPLLSKFLGDITRMSLNLEKSSRDDDLQQCLQIIRTLSGVAGPLGFPDLSVLAIAAEQKLASGNLKSAHHEIRALVVACRRVKSRPAA